MSRPTPETDAAWACFKGYMEPLQDVKDLSRKLERECDEARDEINIIRNTLSQNGEAVGNGEHDFSIIEMVKNLIQSKDYFIRKSDSFERERDEAREEAARWEAVALREASINGARICRKEATK